MRPNVTVNIRMPTADGQTLHYIAAAPADHRLGYSGSGLPFQSENQAMDHTPNKGTIHGRKGAVVAVKIYWPNSFRDTQGFVVPPAIHLMWTQDGKDMAAVKHLGPSIHSRAISYHPSRCALHADFYAGTHELEVRGQEAILMAGGYDAGPRYTDFDAPSKFWGDRPRL